jgi:hypothetical protein
MKKFLLVSIIVLSVIGCKKTEYAPEGPTDVRIRNLTDQTFTKITVSTSEYTDDIYTFETIDKYSTSEYFRFSKAYPKAEISATINGQVYTTGPVNYNSGITYIGQAKITFEVFISNSANKTLSISNCSLDAPLD